MTVDGYLGRLKDLPFGQAAAGDAQAQHDLACGFFTAGQQGRMDAGEALSVALAMGRLAAWHGKADACFAMSVYLAHHALRAPDDVQRDARTAESIAWLHRAAEAGHAEADGQIDRLADDGDAAPILAAAVRFEREL